ncbi:MAG: NUDIX domain-containing protein [Terriglobales bacterium]
MSFSANLFRLCSRAFVAVYGRFPLFGDLRSSVAIIQRGDQFLLQHRSDGLGWAFPGGTALFWENPEQTLRRELLEETGMEMVSCRALFQYRDCAFVPSRISVFAAEVAGTPRGSWEGEVA